MIAWTSISSCLRSMVPCCITNHSSGIVIRAVISRVAQYTQRLLVADVQISMDGKGRALDNIFTERLWRTIKYEEVYLHDYQTPKQAHAQLTAYFDFYNSHRPHQSLGYLTPAEVYFANTITIPNPQQQLL